MTLYSSLIILEFYRYLGVNVYIGMLAVMVPTIIPEVYIITFYVSKKNFKTTKVYWTIYTFIRDIISIVPLSFRSSIGTYRKRNQQVLYLS